MALSGRRKSRGRDRGEFVYQSRDPSLVRQRATAQGRRDGFLRKDIQMYIPSEGEQTVRFLPPTWEGAGHHGLDIYVHYRIGPDRQAFLCSWKMKKEPCPICEAALELRNQGDEDGAKALNPRAQVLAYIVDRNKESEGVKAWAQPFQKIDQEVAMRMENKRTGEVLEIDHPTRGYDVNFTREGKTETTQYKGVEIERSSTKLHDDKEQRLEWLDFVRDNPLPEVLNYHSYETIAKAFGATSGRSGKSDEGGSQVADFEYEDIMELSESRLLAIIDREDLEIDPDDHRTTKKLAQAVATELGLEPEGEDEKPRGRRSRDRDEDDEPRGRRRRGRRNEDDDDEEEEKPRRRRRNEDDEDEDRPRGRRRRDEDDDEEEDRPRSRRRSRDDEDEDDEDDRGGRRTTRKDVRNAVDDAKRRRRSRDDEDEDDEDRPRSRRRRDEDDDDEEEEKPRRRRRRRDDDD